MKVLVCGGRDFNDWDQLVSQLDRLRMERGAITHIIHGGARGADSLAGDYARIRAIQEVVCPANWNWQGNNAGPIRNQKMIELRPDLVVAMPGGKGTADMVMRARKAGVPVIGA